MTEDAQVPIDAAGGIPPLAQLQLQAHHWRVAGMAGKLAGAMGVPSFEAEQIAVAAGLHDIGKLYLYWTSDVLDQVDPLDHDDRALIRKHTQWGAAMLRQRRDPSLELAAQVALEHHERWDGLGYPYGLAQDEICFAARLVSVCDVYDALRGVRPYKSAIPHMLAVEMMRLERGKSFDPQVLEAFLDNQNLCREFIDFDAWQQSGGARPFTTSAAMAA